MLRRLGVVIGRFQVPMLHEGHRYLIETAQKETEQVLVLLGTTGGQPTDVNPLDFMTRKKMIQGEFPNALVYPVYDRACDKRWSKEVDERINECLGELDDAALYGSRDSFASSYYGEFKTVTIPEVPFVSGSSIRKKIHNSRNHNTDFLKGMIFAAKHRYPTVYGTVDIAIVDPSTNKVLVGKKDHDDGYRFVGGYLDVIDDSHEHAAVREMYEETGVEIKEASLVRICGKKVTDVRYQNSVDEVMTTFFMTNEWKGEAIPNDDLDQVAWVPLEMLEGQLIENHKALGKELYEYINR